MKETNTQEPSSVKDIEKSNTQRNPKFHTNRGRRNKGHKDVKVSSKKINDASWYVPNTQLANDAGNIPYSVYVGAKYDLLDDSKATPASYSEKGGIPGIYLYKYIPAIGESSPTAAINMAMRAIYTYVRHANAGHTNYEAPDLMLYILAMDSIYLQIHELSRVLKLAYSYSLGNRLLPKAVFSILGLDYESLVQNLANYRARLNQIIAKVNTLAVPRDFDLFKRRALMGNCILTDEPNKPTQIIIPMADIYYKYNATASRGGRLEGYSVFRNAQASKIMLYQAGQNSSAALVKDSYTNVETMFNNINSCLSVLLSDEDINIMSGDILKAYKGEIYQLAYIEENATLEYSHDENLLAQFANATTIDLIGASVDFSTDTGNQSPLQFSKQETNDTTNQPMIGQRNGTILFHAFLRYKASSTTYLYQVAGRGFCLLNKAPIRSFKTETTPAENLELTRLTMLAINHPQWEDIATTLSGNDYGLIHGTEIGLGWVVITPDLINPAYTKMIQWLQFASMSQKAFVHTESNAVAVPIEDNVIGSTTKAYFVNNLTIHNAVLGLSFGPLPYVLGTLSWSGVTLTYTAIFSISKSSERTAIIDAVTLSTMHDVAILGLLKTPYYSN